MTRSEPSADAVEAAARAAASRARAAAAASAARAEGVREGLLEAAGICDGKSNAIADLVGVQAFTARRAFEECSAAIRAKAGEA